MSINDDHDSDQNHADGDVTQGENPGAQGDFGAGQGEPGVSDTPSTHSHDGPHDRGASAEHGVNDPNATDAEREQAADERTDAGAPPAQPEPPG